MTYSTIGLTETEAMIMDVLDQWSQPTIDGFDGYWYGYDVLSDETGLDIKTLRIILKTLKEQNVIQLEPTYDVDGKLSGRGYFVRQ